MHPAARGFLAGIGLAALVFSIMVGVGTSNPWSLLAVAVVCALLAFPRAIAEVVKSIKLPGGTKIQMRNYEPGGEPPTGTPDFEELARRMPEQQGESELRVRRRKLAELRKFGVDIRNRGIDLPPDERDTWLKNINTWTDLTYAALSWFDVADAEWWLTLDAVPTPRIWPNPLDQEHMKAYRELDYMLVKLDILIQRYSGWDQPASARPPPQGDA